MGSVQLLYKNHFNFSDSAFNKSLLSTLLTLSPNFYLLFKASIYSKVLTTESQSGGFGARGFHYWELAARWRPLSMAGKSGQPSHGTHVAQDRHRQLPH